MEDVNYNVFLGSMHVPLSAISATNKVIESSNASRMMCKKNKIKISGSFQLNKPPILFGYDPDNSRKGSCVNVNEPTYLNLSIIIEPNIPKIHPNMVSYKQKTNEIK